MKKRNVLALIGALGTVAAGGYYCNKYRKKYDRCGELMRKLEKYYHTLNRWLAKRQEGICLDSYFKENGYESIAIYGYKELGERLYDELKATDVKVEYIIDKAADNIYAGVDAYTPDDVLPDVDAVVVTASYYFDEIEEMLRDKLACPIFSIDDVVNQFNYRGL